MDTLPAPLILPMTASTSPFVFGSKIQAPPPQLQPPKLVRTSEASNAIAAQVENISNQNARNADHVKAVFSKRPLEMEGTKARWQQEAAQKRIEYYDLIKRMEQHLSQVPSSQAMQDHRNQRDLEIPKDALQARNQILEEQRVKQQQSHKELRIAKEFVSSQIIDVYQNTT